MDRNMKSDPVILNGRQRAAVDRAIRDICLCRDYQLFALNVRTNHGHSVVSAQCSPDIVMSAFKANATRELRELGLVDAKLRVWSRGGSTRYLWKPPSVQAAIEYTLYGQGDDLPEF